LPCITDRIRLQACSIEATPCPDDFLQYATVCASSCYGFRDCCRSGGDGVGDWLPAPCVSAADAVLDCACATAADAVLDCASDIHQVMEHSNYKPQQSTLIASSGHGTQKLQGTTNCSDNQDVRNSMAAKNNHSGILAIELDEITNVQYVLLCFPNVQYALFLMVPNVQI
jgi:hypothetical protein